MSELLDNKEAATKAVVDWMTKKSKTKTKFYFKDFYKVFPDDKPRLIKKVITNSSQFSQYSCITLRLVNT